jgi:outer membrane protein
MKQLIFSFCLLLLIGTVSAQPYLTLQSAIDTALSRNFDVRQRGLVAEQAEANMKQARANLLPDLGATINHGVNQGRSIDPFTNQFVDQTVNYAGYGLNSGIVLFNGLNLQNTVKQFATAYDASRMEQQQAKDNLTLNVMLAYLQVLNTEDLLSAATKQKEVSEKQLERLQILDKQGAISPSQVTDVKGQLMNDELSILNLRNSLETAKLSLAQLMNIPYQRTMRLERVNAEEFLTSYGVTSSDIYETALQQFSLVKAVELRRKSAEYALKAARGSLFPVLTLGGNAQTNYSSVAMDNAGKIPYKDQLSNNMFYTLNLGLRVPIFTNRRARTNIKLADIALRNTQLLEENTRIQLQQNIEQAHLNMANAYERYKALVQQVEAYNTSFKAAEARLTAGVGTTGRLCIGQSQP